MVVVGPKDLPRLMRTFGHYAGKLRRMGNEFKQQVDEAMREAELVEVRKAVEILRDPSRTLVNAPIEGNLMLPKQHAVVKPYVNSEARTPVVLERAAPDRGAPGARRAAPLRQRNGRRLSAEGALPRDLRGHQGDQGSPHGASDRAPAPAHLVDARNPHRLCRLLLFRAGHLQFAGLALPARGWRRYAYRNDLHRAARVLLHRDEVRSAPCSSLSR